MTGLEHLIQDYAYYAVFIFACIEGEIALLTAGFLCQKNVLNLPYVILFAFLGTLLSEQTLYYVGRSYGTKLLDKYPSLNKKSKKIMEFLKKYDIAFIFSCRFIYGIRNVSPIAIGIAGITPIKFSSLNIPAAAIWAISVAYMGYACADAVEYVKTNLVNAQFVVLIIFILFFIYFVYKKTKQHISLKDK